MRSILFSVIIPSILLVTGIVMFILRMDYGVFISAIGLIWLIISFLLVYKEDEPQPLGMGRGRKR